MTDLIDHIDHVIADEVDGIKPWGLCEKVTQDNHVGPIKDKNRPVSPDDRHQITTYHRLLAGSFENREDLQFGTKFARVNSQRIRMIIFIQEDEEDSVIDDILGALPVTFTIDGYRYIAIQDAIPVNTDDEAIWADEFGESYQDRYRMKYRLYAVEYELQYQLCPTT